MTKHEKLETARAEKFAAVNPTMSARMLAALHRAASIKSQNDIEATIGRLALWHHVAERNGALIVRGEA